MKKPDDKELIARVIATQDTQAFEALVWRNQHLVRNWLRQLSGDIGMADDLAQETFIKAWSKLHTFRGEGNFRSWLMKIAYTNFLQAKRQQFQQYRVLQEASQMEADKDSSGEESAGLDLQKYLAVLNTEERACLILNYAYGYSHREISILTELPLGTVKSNIRRGTVRIRDKFNITGTP
ncbi:MAG: RNA polymerase subunit sigma-70 [Gammaproteobacteria bacterium]|nr:RNA polymerase subunit sigma-70 [Gammaproteobacteria bacterium]MAY03005.1 RNA polymerase subunit sigma-70 [Gammaproteobacteria bacterium]|tara:strand:+ start:44 stop:583 length:540 start_codon:yes stop_codon:yes gene_type:complete